MDDKINDVLQHWGIKGQKWGQRRYQNKDGSLTPAGKKRYSDNETSNDHDNVYDGKKAKTLSDAELKRRIQRINDENTYARLTESGGSKFVKKVGKILGDVASEIAKDYIKKFAKDGINKTSNAIKDVAAKQTAKSVKKQVSKSVAKTIAEQVTPDKVPWGGGNSGVI